MSLQKNKLAFGEFCLDTEEKVLTRNGKAVSLTPKAISLLSVLVESAGRIVEKDQLMSAVWSDSFVEESNLTFTINQIRKALTDSAQAPKYIKTIPRRGYSFIADVEFVPDTRLHETLPLQDLNNITGSDPTSTNSGSRQTGSSRILLISLAVVLSSVAFALFLYWSVAYTSTTERFPIFSEPFSIEKLTTSGKTPIAAISHGGKFVAYTYAQKEQSLWLRDLTNGNIREVIPPSATVYYGLAFSSDDLFIYFSRSAAGHKGQSDIFRIPTSGGIPEKVISEAQGRMSVSPDGTKISFVRCYYRDDENCSLWIADSIDGKNERKLVSRPSPFRIGDNQFSPNGRSIAFSAGQSMNESKEFALMAVDIETGIETELSPERFHDIKSLSWFPNMSGLLISADLPDRGFPIWHIPLNGGRAVQLTRDSENYSIITLDTQFNSIIATQLKDDFQIKLISLDNVALSKVLTDAGSAVFAPDGTILFSSNVSGNWEIWSIKPDGSGQRQLTNHTNRDVLPVVSADNKTIFYASSRSGEAQIWRMEIDGSNPSQLTQSNGGFPISVSSDGEKVFYYHGITRELWSVSTKDGVENLVYAAPHRRFAVSPDGKLVAFVEPVGDNEFIRIVQLSDGKELMSFKTSTIKSAIREIAWLPNQEGLIYLLKDRVSRGNSLWSQPLLSAPPKSLGEIGDRSIREGGLSVSPDGKQVILIEGTWNHDMVLIRGLK